MGFISNARAGRGFTGKGAGRFQGPWDKVSGILSRHVRKRGRFLYQFSGFRIKIILVEKLRRRTNDMKKELLYEMANGFLIDEMVPVEGGAIVEDEFAEGSECCGLYEDVYRAKLSLCERLGENEDRDVETIIGSMERIARLLALKMYEYGGMEQLKEK
jgi:hypothetical protein